MLGAALYSVMAGEVTLDASRDNFGRSNQRNNNSGANEYLAIANSPNIRSIIAFDLSGITNEVTAAEFQFRQHNSVDVPVTLVVAPMAHTKNNASWKEGSGALGVRGQNAGLGEATLCWSAFRDIPWESANEGALQSLLDSGLWKTPTAQLANLQWLESNWIKVPVTDCSMLEKIRKSDAKFITFGLWGVSGKGTYLISSKESGNAPQLVLTLKD